LVRWKRPTFSPSLEYHGEIESINVPPHAQAEVHQLLLVGDWQAQPQFTINMGGRARSRGQWSRRRAQDSV
jgi:hypothetical protein